MKFLPCPFCGGTDIRCDKHHNNNYRREEKLVWSMCCYQCGATFPNRYRKELLIEAWNRRPDGDLVALEIAKAIEAIPPEWPQARKTAHAQVLIRDALRGEPRQLVSKHTPCVWPIGACPHPRACACADHEERKQLVTKQRPEGE